jgi:hypothetical protein
MGGTSMSGNRATILINTKIFSKFLKKIESGILIEWDDCHKIKNQKIQLKENFF